MFTADQLRQQRGSSTPAPCTLPPPPALEPPRIVPVHHTLRAHRILFSYPAGKPRNHQPLHPAITAPAPRRSLTCTPAALPASTPLPDLTHRRAPPTLQVSNFPTSRKANKSASWQVGKLANTTRPSLFLLPGGKPKTPPTAPCHPPPCIPPALAAYTCTRSSSSPAPALPQPTPSTRAGCPSSPYPAGKPHPLQHLTRPNVPPCTRTRRVTFTLDHTHHYPPAPATRSHPPAPPPVHW